MDGGYLQKLHKHTNSFFKGESNAHREDDIMFEHLENNEPGHKDSHRRGIRAYADAPQDVIL